jgi:hypothetical protein
MQRKSLAFIFLLACSFFYFSCQKQLSQDEERQQLKGPGITNNTKAETPHFNLEVILRGEDRAFGHVKFRQDPSPSKIITLDIWVRDLDPNHEYLLQRAVDAINVVDGTCTSTSWLTLGKGLTPQTIRTDARGTGKESLWRDVSALPSGSSFDIHFRVVDATTMAVVLTSDCYQYIVR